MHILVPFVHIWLFASLWIIYDYLLIHDLLLTVNSSDNSRDDDTSQPVVALSASLLYLFRAYMYKWNLFIYDYTKAKSNF